MNQSLFLIRVIDHNRRWRLSQHIPRWDLGIHPGWSHTSFTCIYCSCNLEPPIILKCPSENVHIRVIGEPGKMWHSNSKWKCSVLGLNSPWMGHTHHSPSPRCHLESSITWCACVFKCTLGWLENLWKEGRWDMQSPQKGSILRHMIKTNCLFKLRAMSTLYIFITHPWITYLDGVTIGVIS